jgi:Rrf2 family iron-sulfur cluster assembly transcriptional regulator
MQITRAAEYGVSGLMHLGRLRGGAMAMIDEVSRAEKIPRSFLAKIFQQLGRAGLVQSSRGAHGGFSLAKRPERITVLEIIEAIEGRIVFQRCRMDTPDCEHVGGCALCGLFERAQDGVKDALTSTTLRDLIRQQENVEAVPKRPSAAARPKAI